MIQSCGILVYTIFERKKFKKDLFGNRIFITESANDFEGGGNRFWKGIAPSEFQSFKTEFNITNICRNIKHYQATRETPSDVRNRNMEK